MNNEMFNAYWEECACVYITAILRGLQELLFCSGNAPQKQYQLPKAGISIVFCQFNNHDEMSCLVLIYLWR